MQESPSSLQETADALSRGRAAIYPTDTVYGIGVAIDGAKAPDILYELKRREARKPIAWLIESMDDLDRYGKHVPAFAHVLARTFWPGSLTLVVNASDLVPEAFRSQTGTIGLRMPACETTLQLIAAVGCPLATTSANFSGMPSPHSYDEVDSELAALVGTVMADADDSAKSGIASTVLDCTEDHPRMLREGAVSLADIRAYS